MKDSSDAIRDWIYTVLSGNITYSTVVPVYSFAPKDAAMPYILIGEQTMSGEGESTKDCNITGNDVTIEIYSSHKGNDASYVPVNTIMDLVLQAIKASTTAFTGFNAINVVAESMVTDRFQTDTNVIMYKSINVSFLMEE